MTLVLLGYAATLGYVFFLIFALGPIVQKKTNTETSRKLIHTGLFLVWVLIDLFFKDTVHQIIIPVIFLVLNALSYKYDIYKSVERKEDNHKGTIYFAAAITAVMTAAYFLPELYYPSGIASFCLTFGDGFAAMIGYNTDTPKLRNNKSVSGSIACICSSVIALQIFAAVYPVDFSGPAIFLVSFYAAIFELVGKGLDNFSVTFGTFLMSWLLIRFGDAAMLHALDAALIVFIIVFFAGSIDYYGSLLSMFMVFSFYYFGGAFGLWYLLGTFFTIFAVSVLRKGLRPDLKKEKSRNFLQILINGGLGTLFVILYGAFGKTEYMAVSAAAIGGCFIDSLSSDVGVMSRKIPFDPLKRKKVESGLSGGMTVLGTSAALAGSVILGAVTAWALRLSVTDAVVIALLVFAQTLIDTLLGSGIQVKYRCTVCGQITEKTEHCGEKTEYYSGLRYVNNNGVNFLSSVIVTALACLVYLLP